MQQTTEIVETQKGIDIAKLESTTLRVLIAQAKLYGAAYFSNSPLWHYINWMEAQLLINDALDDNSTQQER